MEFIPSSELKCPKSGCSNYWVRWVGQRNFEWKYYRYLHFQFLNSVTFGQVRWADFCGRCRNILLAEMAQPSLEKLPRRPMLFHYCHNFETTWCDVIIIRCTLFPCTSLVLIAATRGISGDMIGQVVKRAFNIRHSFSISFRLQRTFSKLFQRQLIANTGGTEGEATQCLTLLDNA